MHKTTGTAITGSGVWHPPTLLGNAELWHLKAHTAARMVLAEGLRTRAGS